MKSERGKDPARPEHVYQLPHPDLPDEFPPLRSLHAVPHNLPVQLTSFVGREKELDETRRLLAESRLVTFTGSGGCGKTRLAVQLAAEVAGDYSEGVWLVDLAPLSDPDLVPSAVAAALSVKQVPMQPLATTLQNHLRDLRALILLDNCEHVVAACADLVQALLQACPSLAILATSRETLGVAGEVPWRVPSLDLPPRAEPPLLEALTQSEAVRLFADRAVRARPDFQVTDDNAPAVAEICHRLDGIPLAIELAAARLRLLTTDQIRAGLNDRFRLLTGGGRTALPRQQTLQASVDWSHDLLSESERIVLRRLAVFAGGFTLEAAEAGASGRDVPARDVLDLLSGLVDRSMVQVEEAEGVAARYRLLETIRQYALQRLAESGDADAARDRHLDFFVGLAERAEPELDGPRLLGWVRLLRTEHDNIRAALDWSLSSGQHANGVRLAAALGVFWLVAGHWSEAMQRYGSLLGRELPDAAVRARALVGASINSFQLFDTPGAHGFAEEAVTIARGTPDRRTLGLGLGLMGTALMWLGDFEQARPLLEESVEVTAQAGDAAALAQAYSGLATGIWLEDGDPVRARACFEEGLAAARSSGSPFHIGYLLTLFGHLKILTGDLGGADANLREARRFLEEVGERAFRAMSIAGLAWARLMRGDYRAARAGVEEAVRAAIDASHPVAVAGSRFVLAWLCRAEGDLEAAAAELEHSADMGRATNVPGWAAFWMIGLAVLRIERGEHEAAASAMDAAAEILGERRGYLRGLLTEAQARLARAMGDLERAESLGHESLAQFAEAEMRPSVIDALEFLAWAAASQESYVEAVRLLAAAQSARHDIGYVRFPSQQATYEADVELARSGLTDEDAQMAWAEGAAMSLEKAVAYARRGRGERKRPSAGWASLTPIELEVAKLVAGRLTNPQIAERLFVSRSTVKAHLSHIYAKLNVSSRLELADEVARRQA